MISQGKLFKYFFITILMVGSFTVSASVMDGTISNTYYGALLCTNDICSTTTRINMKPTLGNAVHITDTAVTGDVWSENMGWIRFNPGGGYGGVTNNTSGVLGGYAWGDTAGWISFNCANEVVNNCAINGDFKVTINSTGQLSGYAWAENYGWIKFDCTVPGACTETDWLPLSARPVVTPPHTGGGIITPPAPPAPPTPPTPPEPPAPPAPIPEPPAPPTPPTPPEPPAPPAPIPEPLPPTPVPIPGSTPTPTPEPNAGQGGNITTLIPAITQVVVSQVVTVVAENAKESFRATVEISKKAAVEITKIIETPEGSIASKVVTTTGAVAGASASIATVLFVNPLSFGELFLIPLRLWSLILAALGIKKKNKPWGTVYDSVTKQPLDPAYVILSDLNGKEVATSITDLDGRYGFLVPAGQYIMVAKKTNYNFPSIKLAGKSSDELYQELYFNGVIDVKEGGVIARNIPMDSLKFDWNEFAKKQENLMKFFSLRDIFINHISDILFIFGIVVAIIAVVISPVFYNVAIIVVYITLFILKKTVLRPKAFGYTKESATGKPLPFAIIRVFFVGSENEVIHKITDITGKYYCLIPNGVYYAKIEKKNLDGSYSLVYTSEPIEVKEGYLNHKFEI